jgi:hypothetical protein
MPSLYERIGKSWQDKVIIGFRFHKPAACGEPVKNVDRTKLKFKTQEYLTATVRAVAAPATGPVS